MLEWSVCYATMLLLSFLSTLAVVRNLFRHRSRCAESDGDDYVGIHVLPRLSTTLNCQTRSPRASDSVSMYDQASGSHHHQPQLHTVLVHTSAVYCVLLLFVFYVTLWSLFRLLWFAIVLFQLDGSDHLREILQDPRRDAMGFRGISGAGHIRNWATVSVMILGDTCFIATTLWLFPMTHELFRLVRVTMDRGASREKRVIERYTVAVHTLVLMFLICQSANAIDQGGYGDRNLYFVIMGQSTQFVGLAYITVALCILKAKGRKYEHVHGAFAPAPLYARIRNIMIIYGLFSFQYQLLTISFMIDKSMERVPLGIIGLSNLLFRSIGIGLAFVMGCSQECVLRTFHRYLPTEYAESFYMATTQLSIDLEASRPPLTNPVFVFTDIESSSALWAIDDGKLMCEAHALHDDIIRSLLIKYHGYEITTVGDGFQLAFHTIKDAVEYSIEVQMKLLTADWPKALDTCMVPSVRRQRVKGRLVFAGLRVRIAIHDGQDKIEGPVVTSVHPVTGKLTYTGLSEVIVEEISDIGYGGQVLLTHRVAEWIAENPKALEFKCRAEFIDQYQIVSVNERVRVYQLVMDALEARVGCLPRGFRRRADSLCGSGIRVPKRLETV